MNVQRIFYWLRVGAGVILGILDWLEELEEDGEHGDDLFRPEFKPERIQLWLGILARATLETLDEVGAPPDEGEENGGLFAARGSAQFKPERIQFWLELIARFVVAVFNAANEEKETGKSGERSDGPDSEVGW